MCNIRKRLAVDESTSREFFREPYGNHLNYVSAENSWLYSPLAHILFYLFIYF